MQQVEFLWPNRGPNSFGVAYIMLWEERKPDLGDKIIINDIINPLINSRALLCCTRQLGKFSRFCIGKRALKINHIRSKCTQDTEF